jgi:hypothetical protein
MDWIIAAGSGCLGFLVGVFLAYFVFELDKMDHKALYAAVGVIGGASVIAIFHLLGGLHVDSRREYWFYPMGLLVGFIAGTIHEYIAPSEIYEAKLKRRVKAIGNGEDLK